MPENDFESTNFAKIEEVVLNFGGSDDEIIIFNICRCGLMPNLIKKSWTVSKWHGLTAVQCHGGVYLFLSRTRYKNMTLFIAQW